VSESAAAAASEGTAPHKSTAPRTRDAGVNPGPFARVGRFVRQVVAELKKVVYPTRSELVSWTSVVVVFVVIMMTFITLVDIGVGKLMFWVFGG